MSSYFLFFCLFVCFCLFVVLGGGGYIFTVKISKLNKLFF